MTIIFQRPNVLNVFGSLSASDSCLFCFCCPNIYLPTHQLSYTMHPSPWCWNNSISHNQMTCQLCPGTSTPKHIAGGRLPYGRGVSCIFVSTFGVYSGFSLLSLKIAPRGVSYDRGICSQYYGILPPVLFFELDEWLELCSGFRGPIICWMDCGLQPMIQ